jgi:hypothetical protein
MMVNQGRKLVRVVESTFNETLKESGEIPSKYTDEYVKSISAKSLAANWSKKLSDEVQEERQDLLDEDIEQIWKECSNMSTRELRAAAAKVKGKNQIIPEEFCVRDPSLKRDRLLERREFHLPNQFEKKSVRDIHQKMSYKSGKSDINAFGQTDWEDLSLKNQYIHSNWTYYTDTAEDMVHALRLMPKIMPLAWNWLDSLTSASARGEDPIGYVNHTPIQIRGKYYTDLEGKVPLSQFNFDFVTPVETFVTAVFWSRHLRDEEGELPEKPVSKNGLEVIWWGLAEPARILCLLYEHYMIDIERCQEMVNFWYSFLRTEEIPSQVKTDHRDEQGEMIRLIANRKCLLLAKMGVDELLFLKLNDIISENEFDHSKALKAIGWSDLIVSVNVRFSLMDKFEERISAYRADHLADLIDEHWNKFFARIFPKKEVPIEKDLFEDIEDDETEWFVDLDDLAETENVYVNTELLVEENEEEEESVMSETDWQEEARRFQKEQEQEIAVARLEEVARQELDDVLFKNDTTFHAEVVRKTAFVEVWFAGMANRSHTTDPDRPGFVAKGVG